VTLYVYAFAPNYSTAQRGTSATPHKSGYVDMSVLGPFRAGSGPHSQLAWLWPPRHSFSVPLLCRCGWMSPRSTVDIRGPLLHRIFSPAYSAAGTYNYNYHWSLGDGVTTLVPDKRVCNLSTSSASLLMLTIFFSLLCGHWSTWARLINFISFTPLGLLMDILLLYCYGARLP
jgi:hypothetical protein